MTDMIALIRSLAVVVILDFSTLDLHADRRGSMHELPVFNVCLNN